MHGLLILHNDTVNILILSVKVSRLWCSIHLPSSKFLMWRSDVQLRDSHEPPEGVGVCGCAFVGVGIAG